MSEIPRLGGVVVSGSRQITDFHYPNMRFPVSEGTEWPKWVNMTGYASQVVYNAEQEAALLARPAQEPKPSTGLPRYARTTLTPLQTVRIENGVQVKQPSAPVLPIPDVWWRNALMWLSRKLEALARI